jgi:hypothetical protein
MRFGEIFSAAPRVMDSRYVCKEIPLNIALHHPVRVGFVFVSIHPADWGLKWQV